MTVDPTAGPLAVTGTPTGSVDSGTTSTVTWDVNNTQRLAPTVRLLMSTDGGTTYPVALTGAVANTGSTQVTWPRQPTTSARIKLEAIDNVFFDIAGQTFTLIDVGPPAPTIDTEPPRVVLTHGAPNGSVATRRKVRYGFVSDDPAAKIACTLDNRAVNCAGGTLMVRDLSAGEHTITAQATDTAGNISTRIERTIVFGRDTSAMTRRGRWISISHGSALGGSLLKSTSRGATLQIATRGNVKFALVARTGPKSGTVAVWLDRRRVATVSLRGSRNWAMRAIKVPVRVSGGTHHLRLTALDKRPVVMDAIAFIAAK